MGDSIELENMKNKIQMKVWSDTDENITRLVYD